MAISLFDGCTLFGAWPLHPGLDLGEMQEAMAQNNIARALVLSTTGIFYDFRAGNERTLEVCKSSGDRLRPLATLDPRAYPACLDEASSLAQRGFSMVRFFPARQGWPIAFAPFRELLHRLDEIGLSVAVEIGRPGDITELADAVAFTNAPLLIAGATSDDLGEALCVLRSSPKFHLETTHLLAPGALETVVSQVEDGASRLIFASSAPLRYLSTSLAVVAASTLSGEDKARVVSANLERLLKR